MNVDIRWKQRFLNFKKALGQLKEFFELPQLNKFEVQGLIKCFEYTFPLGLKTMEDYLQEQGFDPKTPRTAIQTAQMAELIEDGYVWLDALNKRNLMAHTYNEELAKEAERLIRTNYYPMLNKLFATLEGEL